MAHTDVLTLRLDSRTSRRLARLAKATDRTRVRLAEEALAKFLDDQAWQLAAIEEGVAAADAGEVVAHDDIEAWVKSWGTRREAKRPR